MATLGEVPPGQRAYLDSRITALAQALGKPASRGEITTARGDDVAVVQALELLNGAEIHELIAASPTIAKPPRQPDLKRLTDQLYRRVLSRPASNEEKRLGQALLAGGDLPDGLGDMYWCSWSAPNSSSSSNRRQHALQTAHRQENSRSHPACPARSTAASSSARP